MYYYNLIDDFMCWWYDQLVSLALKMYYWPAFIAGTADDFTAIFNPKTYSICKF